MNTGNCYDLLGLYEGASMQEIKTAYRRLALRYHPDRNLSKQDGEKFKLITEAYGILRSHHNCTPHSRPREAQNAATQGYGEKGGLWNDLKIEKILRGEISCYSRHAGRLWSGMQRYEREVLRQCGKTVGYAKSRVIPSVVGMYARGPVSRTRHAYDPLLKKGLRAIRTRLSL